jgi:hypothetical protein
MSVGQASYRFSIQRSMEFIAGRGATGGTGAGSAINVGDSGSGETGNGVVCCGWWS